MFYSREATANRAPGPPLVYTESGRFESALVAENVEVAAAAGGGGDDDDDDDNVNSAPVGGDDDDDDDNDDVESAPVGGDDDDDDDDGDDVESAPVAENVGVAAAAGRAGGDDDDDADDADDNDDGYASRREYRKRKGKLIRLGPIKLVRGGGWCDNCNAATDGPV